MPPPVQPAAAAHSADTAAAGQQVLAAGGSAADAAVAMTLAACVVEPFVVSLLSGMHAVHVDDGGLVEAVDGFVDVPARTSGGRTVQTAIDFGGARVPYTIGGATFGTPGLLDGCWALHRRHGRLPWADVVAPARALADVGFVLSDRSANLLAMLEPVMTLGLGGEVFCTDGRLRVAGERVVLPEVGGLLDAIAEQGGQALTHGPLAAELATFCGDVGSLVDGADLAAMTAQVHRPPAVRLDGWTVRSRRGLSPLLDSVERLDALHRLEPAGTHPDVQVALAQQPSPPKALGTTSLAAVDAEGRACAVTASLGLGTGDWFRGQQLNSMLGEVDLLVGGLHSRTRMGSMMAPTVLQDPAGGATVLGAAGGSRIPSAVLRCIDGVVGRGCDAVGAVDLPRIHRDGATVHVEPEVDEAAEAALLAAGFTVQRWTTRQHFFGGVSIAGHVGAEGDPRRGGVALTP